MCRSMGYYIRFINNRDLAVENIMTAVCRARVVLGAPAGVISGLLHRLKVLQLPLPTCSIIGLASHHMQLKGDLRGMYSMQRKHSRRNTINVDNDSIQCRDPAGQVTNFVSAALLPLVRSLGFPQGFAPVPGWGCALMIAGNVTSPLIT